MTKSKLIRLEIGKTINEIANSLAEIQYKSGHDSGVELIDKKSLSLEGKFIEKIVTQEDQIDPFGAVITNKIVRFSIFQFKIIELKPHQFLVKVDTPPRSLKSFTHALQSSLGFGVAFYNVPLNLSALISDVHSLYKDKKWVLKKARISGVKLTTSSVSLIEIYSLTNAYEDAATAFNLENTSIEKIWYELKTMENSLSVEISKSGLLVGDDCFIVDLLPLIISRMVNPN